MSKHLIVVQAGAIEKDGAIHVPSHWHFILKAYGELLRGSTVLCRLDRNLKDKATLPIPEGLCPVLLEDLDCEGIKNRIEGYKKARKIIRILAKRVNLVISILPSNLGNMAASIALDLKKPLLVEVAGETKLYDKRMSLKLPFRYIAYRRTKYIDAKVIRESDCVFYVSRYLAEVLPQKPKNFAVIPHTNISNKDLFRREDSCLHPPFKIFSANRMVREKGLHNLLLAIKYLRQENYDVIATLAGDGDYLEDLRRKCDELGLNSYVTFPGHINAGDGLWRMYRESDMMVLPTLASGEGTPKCIIEAMASSCPVVASAVGGIPMIFREAQSGTGVTMGSVPELIEAIRQIITDGGLRRRYIENGFNWAQEATLEKRSEKINLLLTETFPFVMKSAYV